MSAYNNLIGLPYKIGHTDCYSIVRDYYRQVYGLRFRNYARPDHFWEDNGLDLYRMFKLEGAKAVTDDTLEIGDVLLMPLMTPFPTHACILVDNNLVLHHPPGRLSIVEPLRKWQNRATIVVRHPEVTRINAERQKEQAVHLHEVINADVFRSPDFQAAVARVLGSER